MRGAKKFCWIHRGAKKLAGKRSIKRICNREERRWSAGSLPPPKSRSRALPTLGSWNFHFSDGPFFRHPTSITFPFLAHSGKHRAKKLRGNFWCFLSAGRHRCQWEEEWCGKLTPSRALMEFINACVCSQKGLAWKNWVTGTNLAIWASGGGKLSRSPSGLFGAHFTRSCNII